MFYEEKDLKETSIGKIPRKWEVVRLEDVLNLRNGSRPKLVEDGDIPVYGASGVMGYTTKTLVGNDFAVIIGRVGASGDVHLGQGEIWVSDNAIYSDDYDKDRVDLVFMTKLLRFKELGRFATKTTHPIITQSFLNLFQVQLPPVKEQKAIVGVLSVADSAIQKVDEVIAKTERLKKGLIHHLLTKGIRHKKFKDTIIGKIPETWTCTKLGKVGEFQYGFTASAQEEDSGVRFLRITDIDEGEMVDWSTVPYVQITDSDFDKYRLEKGDVLFARIGATTGKTCYIDQPIAGVFASYLIRLRPTDNIDSKFLYYYTQSNMYWLQIYKIREGQLKKGLNLQLLGNLRFPVPPISEQHRIVRFLSTVDEKLALEKREKARLESIKRGLMDLLLTGKIRVEVD